MKIISSYDSTHRVITSDECDRIISGDQTTISNTVNSIASFLHLDVLTFEPAYVRCLKPNQTEKLHVDYFIGVGLSSQLKYGGNRIKTIVLDLNTTDGGTWFPWIQHTESTELGKLTVIDYSDPTVEVKIKSEHSELVSNVDRWQLIIYVRAGRLNEQYHSAIPNLNYYSQPLQSTELSIVCGPINDRRILSLELPPNDKIGTGLIVGFTSGIDSSLLLYLLATINSYQTIPYVIQPVLIDNRLGSADYPDDKYWNPINESWTNVIRMIDFIKSEIPNGFVQAPARHTVSPHHKRYYQTSHGLMEYYRQCNNSGPNRYITIYEATLENIPELENSPEINYNAPSPWKLPFSTIQKQHVIDVILESGLEKIFEITGKCPVNHETLTEKCDLQWQCMERRLGFIKLCKPDLGAKYLLNHDK